MNPEEPIERKKVRKNPRIKIIQEDPVPALSLKFVNADALDPKDIQGEVISGLQSLVSPTNIIPAKNIAPIIVKPGPTIKIKTVKKTPKLDAPQEIEPVAAVPKKTRAPRKTKKIAPLQPPVLDEERVIEGVDKKVPKRGRPKKEKQLPEKIPPLDVTAIAKSNIKMEANPPANVKEEGEDVKHNAELLQKERAEYNDYLANPSDEYDFLYPHLNDPNFIVKLSKHKEFYDTQYDGQIHPIEKQSELLCNTGFELLPHQLFVKNFLSMQTPYNSLLLYHGLGSGKTCSSIGIAEEMRSYMKQLNITKRILVIASPNVQANFRLQLFDETKLEYLKGRGEDDGIWNINSCVGNSLIKEINPTNLKGLSREKVISSIKRIINNSYLFMGYIQLTNYIFNAIKKSADIENLTKQQRKKLLIKHIRELFDNRLIIIDEVHNIRISDDNQERKKTALLLMKVAKYSQNMRLLLLSATPMFNSYQEIVWLTNLMNINDKRATIKVSDVFDSKGQWVPAKQLANGTMTEDGKTLLIRKLTGYISYVRGENPYTFPYRVYPSQFAEMKNVLLNEKYPSIQLNGSPISEEEAIKYIDVFTTTLDRNSIQYKGYKRILDEMKAKSNDQYTMTGRLRKMPAFEDMESFGYTSLQLLIEALNIVYPNPILENPAKSSTDLSEDDEENEISRVLVGESGLRHTMNYIKETKDMMQLKYKFSYKPEIKERIFAPKNIGKYSAKIEEICNCIRDGRGIIMIYSQYIDGGLVPMALALEEMGFSRYGSSPNTPNLFATPPGELVDYKMQKKTKDVPFHQAKYVMITGDKAFSHNNVADIKVLTHPDNKDGKNVKVILLSRAGAEGLDFKNIRQVHIMEPWYNMNRIEQIIGRAVRNLSHCKLDFKKRNVEIYLHGTLLPGVDKEEPEESADLYVYRYAEKKAIQIGQVTRVLKTIAVDCILNLGQTNFSVQKLFSNAANQNISIKLSRYGQEMPFQIGDRPFSEMCDYMKNCEFVCSPMETITEPRKENYNNTFVQNNQDRIIKRIRELYREKMPAIEGAIPYLNHAYYEREHLINAITIVKQYPIEQIYSALSALINNKNEYLIDAYGRTGRLIDKYDANTDTAYYVFQPIEITDENASLYERSVPIEHKRANITLEIDKTERMFEPDKAAKAAQTEVATEQVAKIDQLPKSKFSEIMRNLDICFDGIETGDPKTSKKGVLHTTALKKGEYDWYEHAGMIYHYSKPENPYIETQKTKGEGKGRAKKVEAEIIAHDLPIQQIRTVFGLTNELFEKYIILHFMESLLYSDKLDVVRHFYSLNNVPSSPREQIVYEYLETKIVKSGEETGFVTIKDDTLILIMLNRETGEWTEADQEDYTLMAGELRKFQLDRTPQNMYSLIGFITPFVSKKTNEREMVFKVKDMTEKRNNIGARIDDAGKDKVIKLLNTLVGSPLDNPTYTDKNTEFVNQLGICIVIELLMRLFSDQRLNNKYYYLSPEQAILSEVIKKSFSSV
uniref:Helicase ATP-binding domain-containing protein n=1 Tax=viral metagenome TaxID=1070528 RepID=A0A6C0K1J0_9ZZZZ